MTYTRDPWQYRFAQPDLATLRSQLKELDVKLFDRARSLMEQMAGVNESMRWFDHPWYWTLTYFDDAEHEDEDPLGVLIPNPNDLQFAMSIDRELAESLAGRKIRRSIQECLSLVREPFDTRWCTWTLLGTSMVDDLFELVDLKRARSPQLVR